MTLVAIIPETQAKRPHDSGFASHSQRRALPSDADDDYPWLQELSQPVRIVGLLQCEDFLLQEFVDAAETCRAQQHSVVGSVDDSVGGGSTEPPGGQKKTAPL